MTKTLDLNQDLGLEAVEVQDDELAFGAVLVIVTRGMSDRGQYTRISTRTSRNLDFVTYRGMMELAHDECVATSPMGRDEDEEEGTT